MSESAREVAMNAAYKKLLTDFARSGNNDALTSITPYNECWSGAAQLKVPVIGVREPEMLGSVLRKMGYSVTMENDALTDQLQFVVLVPFVMEDGVGNTVIRTRASSGGISVVYLLLFLIAMVVFAVYMTPTQVLRQLLD